MVTVSEILIYPYNFYPTQMFLLSIFFYFYHNIRTPSNITPINMLQRQRLSGNPEIRSMNKFDKHNHHILSVTVIQTGFLLRWFRLG